ncbi:hypothetical protein VP01_2637g1 [Puccinia sorghi]|uniref:Uncharacterized protein n=1 Tax=Puccinia sorghi TaxID=27349 RepID=A0A0L6V495_9BASI|nr:hypothetical protein VP01_2637g1 [Puccinia sorghi]
MIYVSESADDDCWNLVQHHTPQNNIMLCVTPSGLTSGDRGLSPASIPLYIPQLATYNLDYTFSAEATKESQIYWKRTFSSQLSSFSFHLKPKEEEIINNQIFESNIRVLRAGAEVSTQGCSVFDRGRQMSDIRNDKKKKETGKFSTNTRRMKVAKKVSKGERKEKWDCEGGWLTGCGSRLGRQKNEGEPIVFISLKMNNQYKELKVVGQMMKNKTHDFKTPKKELPHWWMALRKEKKEREERVEISTLPHFNTCLHTTGIYDLLSLTIPPILFLKKLGRITDSFLSINFSLIFNWFCLVHHGILLPHLLDLLDSGKLLLG